MIAALCRDLGRLIRRWWTTDRIRVSPSEGRLSRIQPGDLVAIGEMQAEVVARSVVENMSGSTLCLTCRTSSGMASLQWNVSVDGSLSAILWNDADECRTLTQNDFEVWPRQRML